jgi:hypothetical protein
MSKYDFGLYLIKKGDVKEFKLPKRDPFVDFNSGRKPKLETKIRQAANNYAQNHGFKISCKKRIVEGTKILTIIRMT